MEPLFCNSHWHNYFLQLGQVVWASVQSIFIKCLWFNQILSSIIWKSSLLDDFGGVFFIRCQQQWGLRGWQVSKKMEIIKTLILSFYCWKYSTLNTLLSLLSFRYKIQTEFAQVFLLATLTPVKKTNTFIVQCYKTFLSAIYSFFVIS